MNNYIFCWELRPINPKFVQMNAHSITSIACRAASTSESGDIFDIWAEFCLWRESDEKVDTCLNRLIKLPRVAPNVSQSTSDVRLLGFFG